MSSLFNADFQDFVRALNDSEVEYVLLGGYAVILYGYDRTTGDMDVWVNHTSANYQRLRRAFAQFGVPPSAIDILTKAKGVAFDDCYPRSSWIVHEGLKLRVISREDLVRAKAAVGRLRDRDDLEKLGESL